MPNTKNFGYSTVLTAPSPASSGTSLVVQSADGAKFPSTPFNATVWPAGAQALSTNAEIVTVTNVSTDTFTITRGAESSSARSILVGDQIDASITAGLFPAGTVVGTTDTQTLTNKIISNEFMGDVWDNQGTIKQSVTLLASNNFAVFGSAALGSTTSLTVPSTTSVSVQAYIPLSQQKLINQGWVPASGTWTFVSSTTMTVPLSDALNMAVGTKLQLFQTGLNYFYVTAIAGNLITINGGSDYTLANSAITAAYYSNTNSPPGFPQWFNYTATLTNVTIGNGALTGSFRIIGRDIVYLMKLVWGSTTSYSGVVSVSLPVATGSGYTTAYQDAIGNGQYNHVGTIYQGPIFWTSTTTVECDCESVATFVKAAGVNATQPFTWASTDILSIWTNYRI